MGKTFDQGKDDIAKLCQYFSENKQAFLAPGVKEAHVRQSLIDPLFEALGWDVRNSARVAHQYREVISEDSLEVEGQQKAPDYAFRVGTLPKFYAEAKKCGANINADPAPAFQLRRYGWSARVALSLLTDFEELGVYDCTLRPKPGDKAGYSRLQYLHFEEYPDRWRELWDIFSREAVWSGAFDRFAASKRKRGTSEVDSEFLKEIEGWRDELAHNIALRNRFLGPDDLNAAVQRTIDRVVFLRMAEDRGSEPYGQLLKLCERPDIYKRFMKDLCRQADEKYNSGIFHFQKEPGVSEEPDRITPALTIDDKVFKPILQSLYFEHGSPYHFGVLPVEILGTVYERFLGKVIRLTAEHRAKVEEKPEVRKAGGVYYTPSYIVDYIVQNTVGKMIEGKSPAQLAGGKKGQPLRILDMACGSGSFLLGAFQCLLYHCLKWYTDHEPEKHKEEVYRDLRGDWRLTITGKKRILTTHIFGVDIDNQAVEVSKLSLLLKVLEGETDQSLGQSRQLFQQRALPNLSENIKCGNSLIGPDYFSGRLISDPEEMKRVNPFDWKKEFPEAMKSGGFDCVIGNPPYGAMFKQDEIDYLLSHFKFQNYKLDSYLLFLERSLGLARHGGFISVIIPNTWLLNLQNERIRKNIFNLTQIEDIVHFQYPVFILATVDTEILVLKNLVPNNKHQISIALIDKLGNKTNYFIPQKKWQKVNGKPVNILERSEFESIVAKIKRFPILDTNLIVTQGTKPFQVGKGKPFQTQKIVDEKPFVSETKRDSSFRPLLRGSLINRYKILWNKNYWISFGDWLAEPRYSANYDSPAKIIIRQTGDSLIAVLDDSQFIVRDNLYTIVFREGEYDLNYVLGLLNSRLLNWFYQTVLNPEKGEALAQVKRGHIAQLPIRTISLSNPTDKLMNDKMIQLVKSMLDLHKKKAAARSERDTELIQRQIEIINQEIDKLVYKLYGLTDDEIKIVESK